MIKRTTDDAIILSYWVDTDNWYVPYLTANGWSHSAAASARVGARRHEVM